MNNPSDLSFRLVKTRPLKAYFNVLQNIARYVFCCKKLRLLHKTPCSAESWAAELRSRSSRSNLRRQRESIQRCRQGVTITLSNKNKLKNEQTTQERREKSQGRSGDEPLFSEFHQSGAHTFPENVRPFRHDKQVGVKMNGWQLHQFFYRLLNRYIKSY